MGSYHVYTFLLNWQITNHCLILNIKTKLAQF